MKSLLSKLFIFSNSKVYDSVSQINISKISDTTSKSESLVATDEYTARVQQELLNYNNVDNIHELPKCFHYITNKYLCPIIKEITGFSDFKEFFASEIDVYANQSEDIVRIASIGSGNSEEEIDLYRRLKTNKKVVFDCYELNPTLIAKGREKAEFLGIEMRFFQQDFNEIEFQADYDIFFASHSLHHVVNLEGLFDAVHNAGKTGYFFLINDMIGRNGHMSWPKAQSFLESLWLTLPERLKWNAYFKRFDINIPNFDCSQEGFEGIRAQDILPLLIEKFEFEFFIPFFSYIGRIIDRAYGHNYIVDLNKVDNDCLLLDHMWYMDELLLNKKYLAPTQMFAKVVDPRLNSISFRSRIYKHPAEAVEIEMRN